jgi:hypothetical protein
LAAQLLLLLPLLLLQMRQASRSLAAHSALLQLLQQL